MREPLQAGMVEVAAIRVERPDDLLRARLARHALLLTFHGRRAVHDFGEHQVQLRVGVKIWDGAGRYLMLALGASGVVLAATTGSPGGHLMGSPSRFTGLLGQFGWNVYQTYFAPGWVLIIMLIVGTAGIIVGIAARPKTGYSIKRNSSTRQSG